MWAMLEGRGGFDYGVGSDQAGHRPVRRPYPVELRPLRPRRDGNTPTLLNLRHQREWSVGETRDALALGKAGGAPSNAGINRVTEVELATQLAAGVRLPAGIVTIVV